MNHENDNIWSFIENVEINDQILSVGLETIDKIERQLDVDIPRLDVTFNGDKIICKDQIITNDLTILRCCTQSVFFQPLSYLINLFPDVHILHERKAIKSSINIHTKKYYNSGILSYLGLVLPITISDCILSTYFSACRKNDLKCVFQIYMQFIFDINSNVGTLLFQIIK